MTYEIDWASDSVKTVQETHDEAADALPDDLLEEKIFAEQYEKKLMEQLDDNTLARIFSGVSDSVSNKKQQLTEQPHEITRSNSCQQRSLK